MQIRDASPADIPGITLIFNDAVVNTTAIWSDKLVDDQNRQDWLAARRQLGYPVLVAVEGDKVLGYASFGDWRPFDGYRHSVEHSVYVHKDHRGEGLGVALMQALIPRARAVGKHVMVAAIDASNVGSIALHKKLGFEQVGHMPQVGTKFGKWLDLAFLQLTLDQRTDPDNIGS
ncbi:N-acetyltransferase family protein [Herbaspirillum huttiense F1]|uniref:GNAT family N-acetyltransferase n=1 Tax=Herbaspirillum huttiense TaxID=863372 RepID=UPI002884E88E|nr:N-acetyltransferase family protein [Herbaspirillum huttiense]MDT0357096.1 N-acetyltransferase family protein [Herbaspirillum huttiense F1]